MSGNRTGKGIKRRRVDDSISKSFAHKHKNSSKFKDVQERRIFTERYFWTLSSCILAVWDLIGMDPIFKR